MDLDPRALVGAAPVPWCLVDADGAVQRASDAMGQLCDCPPDQLMGRHLPDLVAPAERDALRRALAQESRWSLSTRLEVGSAQPHVSMTGAPVPAGQAAPPAIVVLTDVSELVRASAEVDELRRAALDLADQRIALVATVTHELRSPLHAINGWGELLADTALDPSQRELVDSLMTAVQRLRQTVDEFLEISRLDAGEVPLRPTSVDLRELLEMIVDRHRQRAADSGTPLNVTIGRTAPTTIHVDPYRLDQILTNLLSNAVTHGGGGPVEVALEAVGGTGRVVVRDHGPGIPEAYRERVFDAFVRVPGSSSGGTGLGLPLVRSLARRLGGDVTLESPTDGGARFVLALPLLTAGPTPQGPSDAPTPEPRQAATARVLVVEDNEMIQLLSAQQLRSLGHQPTVVGTGTAALEALVDQQLDVDLVLMDWQLPDLPGTEVCRRFREAERRLGRSRTPVVALTANAMPDTRAACLAAGMDDFLPKPVSIAALGTMVVRWTTEGTGNAAGLPVLDVAHLLALGAGGSSLVSTIATTHGQLNLLETDLRGLAADPTADPGRVLHGHRAAIEVLGLLRLADVLAAFVDQTGDDGPSLDDALNEVALARGRVRGLTDTHPADQTGADRNETGIT